MRDGVQLYKCNACGTQFRAGRYLSDENIWELYMNQKQTVKQIAQAEGCSESTIKRHLKDLDFEWVQPDLYGGGFILIDVTYWGRNWGVLIAIDCQTRKPLYLAFVSHETAQDYVDAVESIEKRGYTIRGIVTDGNRNLFKKLSSYRMQMCQFHMKAIVRRYLTQKPKLLAARELRDITNKLHTLTKEQLSESLDAWYVKWKLIVNKRSPASEPGKTKYRHKRLRTVWNSLCFYLPYLFVYQTDECVGMPNTNNMLEGLFSDMKRKMNNHSGMREAGRKRFIIGFLKALDKGK